VLVPGLRCAAYGIRPVVGALGRDLRPEPVLGAGGGVEAGGRGQAPRRVRSSGALCLAGSMAASDEPEQPQRRVDPGRPRRRAAVASSSPQGQASGSPAEIRFLVYDQAPEPPSGQWSHTEAVACTATDAPASFTTGTDPDDMFEDPMPPDNLVNRPALEPPYHCKGRLLIANDKKEVHVLQFWPA
jgi:hypothetical protein